MSKSNDWLPGSRTEKLAMAATWCGVITKKVASWNIPTTALTQLETAVEAAEISNGIPESARTAVTNAQLKIDFDRLTAVMRDIKKRYLYNPPLTDADFAALELKPKDVTPTTVAPPTGQAEADISYPGKTQLQAKIKHVEGTPMNPKAEYGYRIYYGLYDAGDTPPASGVNLHESKFTRQKKVLFSFLPADSGKTAYFSIRYENSKGESGPWGPMFSAIIP